MKSVNAIVMSGVVRDSGSPIRSAGAIGEQVVVNVHLLRERPADIYEDPEDQGLCVPRHQ